MGLVGFVDADPLPWPPDLEGILVLGGPEDLTQIVQHWGVERVIVAFAREKPEVISAWIAALEPNFIWVDIVPQLFDNL